MIIRSLPFVGVLLPLALSILLAARWWAELSRPWLFFVLGTFGLYALMVLSAVLAFRNIGIAGVPQAPEPFLGSFEVELLLRLVAFVALGTLGLWGLRLLFPKSEASPR